MQRKFLYSRYWTWTWTKGRDSFMKMMHDFWMAQISYWKISYMSQRIFTWKIPFWWKYAVDWISVIVGCGGGGEYKNLEFLKHEWSEHELIWHTESSDICKTHVYYSKFRIFIKNQWIQYFSEISKIGSKYPAFIENTIVFRIENKFWILKIK